MSAQQPSKLADSADQEPTPLLAPTRTPAITERLPPLPPLPTDADTQRLDPPKMTG